MRVFQRCDPDDELAHDRPARVASRAGGGNTVVRRSIPADLVVGPADDPLEHEADEVAREVVRSLADGRSDLRDALGATFPGRSASTRVRRSSAAIRRTPHPVVQRYGDGDLDFGPPNALDHLVTDDARRLTRIKSWLDANDTKFDWLGLHADDMTAPAGNLSERIAWATTHLPMWLDASLTPSRDEWKVLDGIYLEGDTWLETHQQTPFVAVDAAIDDCRALGLGWLADELADKRDAIIRIVANGKPGDGHQKKANLRARSLDELARSLDPVIASLSSKASEFEDLRQDVAEGLDQIDEWTAIERLAGRKAFIKESESLRRTWSTYVLALGPPRVKAPTKKSANEPPPRVAAPDRVEDLKRIVGGAGNVVGSLKKLQTGVNDLGERVQDKYDLLSPTQQGSAKTVRPDIVIASTMSPATVASLLPTQFANASSVASDIINQPMGGWTTFTVRGSIVYHSSAGSKSAGNQAGSAFWINQGADRVIVAIGRHVGTKSDEYRITWRAQGVKGKHVKLTPKTADDILSG
jgi:hypothetical protein